MPKQRKKAHLPSKVCPVCKRSFTWRKKWAKDWENVVYCSERCRRSPSRLNPDYAINHNNRIIPD
ncbi:MAG: DUF2256 domain-containing protein [Opitutales bacterium]|nr:DUF2256 domain-containing protein [Opitutales bacterium]